MVALPEIQRRDSAYIRKGMVGSVFLAPVAAPAVTTLTDSTGQLRPLPTGYADVGWLTADGPQWGLDTTTVDVHPWGDASAERQALVTAVPTLVLAMQETRALQLGLAAGRLQTPTLAGNSELSVPLAIVPSRARFRLLMIAADPTADGPIYLARSMPNARVSGLGAPAFSPDNERIYEITLTGDVDETLGYALEDFVAGPGWAALLAGPVAIPAQPPMQPPRPALPPGPTRPPTAGPTEEPADGPPARQERAQGLQGRLVRLRLHRPGR